MSLKKWVTLLAVSTLALTACGQEDNTTEDTAPETEETSTEETKDKNDEAGSATNDLIEQAKQESGDAFPEYGLTIRGNWTTNGYEVEAPKITGSAVTSHEDYYVYLVQDGKIVQKQSTADAETDLPDIAFEVGEPGENNHYVVGITPEDLGDVGADVGEDAFYRHEKIILVPASAPEE